MEKVFLANIGGEQMGDVFSSAWHKGKLITTRNQNQHPFWVDVAL